MKNYNEQIIGSIVKVAYDTEIEKMALNAKGLLTGLGAVGAVGGAGYLGKKYIEDPEKFKETAGVIGKNIQHTVAHPIDSADELLWKLKSKENISDAMKDGETAVSDRRSPLSNIMHMGLIGDALDYGKNMKQVAKDFDSDAWLERHPNSTFDAASREFARQYLKSQKSLK